MVDNVQHEEGNVPETDPQLPYKIRQRVPLRSIRRVIGERMLASIQGSAQLTATRQVDVTDWVAKRNALNVDRAQGDRISFDAILAHQISRALREYPEMNSRLGDKEILQLETVNIGVAMDTERGLMVPVVKDAAGKNLDQIAADLRELQEKVRTGKISLEDVTGGTFTLSNLGMFGIDAFTPILNPPECGILGVGRIRHSWMVAENGRDGVVRQTMVLSLTFDHRLVDGAPAARFLARLSDMIESADLG